MGAGGQRLVSRPSLCLSGERPFVCLICLSAFTTKANCERHLKVHTDTLNGGSLGRAPGRGVPSGRLAAAPSPCSRERHTEALLTDGLGREPSLVGAGCLPFRPGLSPAGKTDSAVPLPRGSSHAECQWECRPCRQTPASREPGSVLERLA